MPDATPREIVSRATLLKEVWQMQAGTETNVVDVYINYLRRKLDDGFATPAIQTQRGEGYRLSPSAANSLSGGAFARTHAVSAA